MKGPGTTIREIRRDPLPSGTDDLVISIGTIDRYEMLEKCLRSIYEGGNAGLRYTVYVVLNGGKDHGAVKRIRNAYPEVRFIIHDRPLGFCVLHNLVMKQARSRYVLLLDDDTVLAKDTLSSMVAFMDAQPKVGIAGCRTVHPDGTFQKTYGLMHNLKTEFLNTLKISNFWPDRIYRDLNGVRDVEWLNGHFMFIRAEVLDTVGLLDEYYYTYLCEPDLCYRITKAGWRVVYVPEIEIVHACGEHSIYTRSRKVDQIVRAYTNRYYFFRKHYGSFDRLLLRPIVLVGAMLRLAFYLWVYWRYPERRMEALTRLKAFRIITKLSLSSRPAVLPPWLHESYSNPPRPLS